MSRIPKFAIAQKYGCMEGEKDAGHLHMAMIKLEYHHYFSEISDIPKLAVICMMGIAKCHAFHDCNKRTAKILGNVFLGEIGFSLDTGNAKECKEAKLDFIVGKISADDFTEFVKQRTSKTGN